MDDSQFSVKKDMPDLLNGLICGEVPHHDVTMKDKNSVYKLSSAIQKCIRRGLPVQAGYYAQAILHGGGEDYLWRRLPIMALEDIGPANVALCAAVMEFCRFKAVREKFGVEKGLTALVQHMAESYKSRTACDLVCSVHFYSNDVDKLYQLEPEGRNESYAQRALQSMLAWGWLPEPQKAVSWVKEGELVGPVNAKEQGEFREAQLQLIWETYGEMAAYLVHSASKKSPAHLHSTMLMAMELLAQDDLKAHTLTLEPGILLRGVPEWAYDQHTLEGKKALAYVLKASDVLKDFSHSFGEVSLNSLGMHMFQVESALLNSYLVTMFSASFQVFNDQLESASCGQQAPYELKSDLQSPAFQEEMRYARKKVLGV